MNPNNCVVLVYAIKHVSLNGFFLVAILLTTAGSIQATHEHPAFLKICIMKPGRKGKYIEKEIFKKKGDREGRKRRKTVSIEHPRGCQMFLFYPQSNMQILL